MMLMMGLYSGVIYANENEGYNIETGTINRNNQTVEILQSQDGGYLKITQIGQNVQNLKITTSTFDEKITVSGISNKGTEITVEVFQGEKCSNTYSATIGITENFSQTIDVAEGDNKVFIHYKNDEDGTKNYVIIYIRRESAADMEKLKTFFEVPSL